MTNNSSPRIGIFDSGLGGLSVRAALQQQLPDASLLYVADSGFAPYGNKTADYVIARSRHIARFLLQQQVDALVIACNTATAAAAATLRAEISLPVIAMEPGLKPAIAASHNGTIAVLATQGTLASEQFSHLRERFAAGVNVLNVPCPGWVELVEEGLHESDLAKQKVAETLAPVLAAGADTLVLGCTHFPFLRNAIRAACGDAVTLIETAGAVAQQTARRLDYHIGQEHAGKESHPPQHHYWSSAAPEKAAAIMTLLLQEQVHVDALPE